MENEIKKPEIKEYQDFFEDLKLEKYENDFHIAHTYGAILNLTLRQKNQIKSILVDEYKILLKEKAMMQNLEICKKIKKIINENRDKIDLNIHNKLNDL